jgi:hypothetical protein
MNPVVEVLQFVFSSFWVWLGVLVLVTAIRGKSIVTISTK